MAPRLHIPNRYHTNYFFNPLVLLMSPVTRPHRPTRPCPRIPRTPRQRHLSTAVRLWRKESDEKGFRGVQDVFNGDYYRLCFMRLNTVTSWRVIGQCSFCDLDYAADWISAMVLHSALLSHVVWSHLVSFRLVSFIFSFIWDVGMRLKALTPLAIEI